MKYLISQKGGKLYMELNYDCIRDVLLEIEKVTTFDKSFTLYNNLENLQQYTTEELQYHLRQCDSAGFLYKYQSFMDGNISVLDFMVTNSYNLLELIKYGLKQKIFVKN